MAATDKGGEQIHKANRQWKDYENDGNEHCRDFDATSVGVHRRTAP